MRKLYARFVLFLIRPALEMHRASTKTERENEIDETVFNKMILGKSMIKDGLEHGYGITLISRQK